MYNNSEVTEGNSSFIYLFGILFSSLQIDHSCRRRETCKSTKSSILVSHAFLQIFNVNVYVIGYSPSGLFQDRYKQTMMNKYSNEHNYVKNPNWREKDQLAIHKRGREVELGATENNIKY